MEKRLKLSNEVGDTRQIAPFVEGLITAFALPADWDYALNLILEEAFSNVVHYAFPEGGVHEVEILAKMEDHHLVLRLEDDGIPFDPTAVPEADVTLSADDRAIGGLGIYLMKQLTDGMTYARVGEKNQLVLVKKVEK